MSKPIDLAEQIAAVLRPWFEDDADDAAREVLHLIKPVLTTRIQQAKIEALQEAADDIQALHPGEVKNSVIWLRDRADRIKTGTTHGPQ